MQKGQGVVWIPGRQVLSTVSFPEKTTFDSSRTPKRGEKAKKTANLKPLNIDALKAKLATVDAEVKANDPKALRAELAKLKSDMAKAVQAKVVDRPVEKIDPKAIEAAYQRGVNDGTTKTLEAVKGGLEKVFEKVGVEIAAFGPKIKTILAGVKIDVPRVATPGDLASARAAVIARPRTIAPTPKRDVEVGDFTLGTPHQRILDAIAWWNAMGIARPKVVQVAFAAGYSMSGTFDTYRSGLNKAGLIETDRGAMALTPEGAALANPPSAPPSVEALHDMVREKLDGPVVKLLNVVLEAYPNKVTVDELAERAGYARSGTFDTYRSKLNTLSLVEAERGEVAAADWLFPKAA
jgi:hypothetical protein